MNQVFARPRSLKSAEFPYCPGCGHSLVHHLLAEAIDELGIAERAIGVLPSGCALLAYECLDLDMGEAPPGQALAVATGLKRALPDHVVFAYQGDGDLAGAGLGEALHAAQRGECLSVLLVNNGVLAPSSGQRAPTTPPGLVTSTTPGGCDLSRHGAPLDPCRLLAGAAGSVYVQRGSLATPELIQQAGQALAKALRAQMDGLGFSLVEVLAPCPTRWQMTPQEALAYVGQQMVETFPLGVFQDATGYAEAAP